MATERRNAGVPEGPDRENGIFTELKVVALVQTETLAKDLEKVLSRMQTVQHRIQKVSSSRMLSEADLKSEPEVIILEVDGVDHRKLQEDITEYLEGRESAVSIFAVFKDADFQLVRELMHVGVKDVFQQPISMQELSMAFTRALSRHRLRAAKAWKERGAVTAFLNVSSGGGATFLAINTAHQLSTHLKKKVVLVDLDIQWGHVATDIDLQPSGTIVDALRDPDRIDRVFMDALVCHHPSGLDVLASPGDLSPLEMLTPPAVSQLLHALMDRYEHVVINMPDVLTAGTLEALQLSNPVMLVMQNSLPMLRNARMMRRRLPLMNIPMDHVEVVFNRADSKGKGVDRDAIAEILPGVPLYAVRSDYEAANEAENQGRPLAEVEPRAGITKDIRALAERLESGRSGGATRKRGLKRLFS